MSTRAEAARGRILDAATRLLVREGGDAVTIAAVAKEAGVSKGGLFYHFASKELLIEGLIARDIAAFDDLLTAAGDAPGAATEAYLHSVEHATGPATQPVPALLASAIVSPTTLDALRETYRRWQARLDEDGVPPHIAAIVRFAVDGIWLADALDLAPPTGAGRREIIARLRELVSEGTRHHGDGA